MKIKIIPFCCLLNTILLIIVIPCSFILLKYDHCKHENKFFHLISDILVDPIPAVVLRQFLFIELFLCILAVNKRITTIKELITKHNLQYNSHVKVIVLAAFTTIIFASATINIDILQFRNIHLVCALFFFLSSVILIILDSLIIPFNFGLANNQLFSRFLIEISVAVTISISSLISTIAIILKNLVFSNSYMNLDMIASISECIFIVTLQIYAGVCSLDLPAIASIVPFHSKGDIMTVL